MSSAKGHSRLAQTVRMHVKTSVKSSLEKLKCTNRPSMYKPCYHSNPKNTLNACFLFLFLLYGGRRSGGSITVAIAAFLASGFCANGLIGFCLGCQNTGFRCCMTSYRGKILLQFLSSPQIVNNYHNERSSGRASLMLELLFANLLSLRFLESTS